jgi:trigger factor
LRKIILKIETETLDNHQVKLVVEADPDQLEVAKRKAARQIAKRIKIPGFRPGKAPYNVIERQVGEEAILDDAIEQLAQDLYPQALDEAGIKPYGPGTLEKIPSTDPPQFEFMVPLQAEVELGDYQSIRIPYEPDDVSEDEIEQTLKNIQDQQAVVEQVERSAEESDLVRIVLSGERLDPEEGQDPSLIRERTLPVIIEPEDADTTSEWPFPGFSRELLGTSADGEKIIEHVFSDDSPYESLRGTKARFNIKVEQVSSRTLPDLDDEFAISVSDFDTIEEFNNEVREELEASHKESYNREYDEQVIQQIIDQSSLKYPPQMVDHELEHLIADLEGRLAQQGLDLDTYLKINQQTEEELKAEMRETAEARLRRSLVIFELARKEDIQVPENEVQTETINTLDALSRSIPQDELRKLTSRDQIQNLVSNIMTDMLVHKTIEHIRAIASDNKSLAANPEEVDDAEPEVEGKPEVEGVPEIESIPEAASNIEAETASSIESEIEIEDEPEAEASTPEVIAEVSETENAESEYRENDQQSELESTEVQEIEQENP